MRAFKRYSRAGFTLVELMIAVAIVAILASISLPAYTAYVQRSRVPPALVALLSYQVRMEQRFQDAGSYANGEACAIAAPAVAGFTVTCTLGDNGTGYTYTINDQGTRITVAHPRGVPSNNCWSIRGATCEG